MKTSSSAFPWLPGRKPGDAQQQLRGFGAREFPEWGCRGLGFRGLGVWGVRVTVCVGLRDLVQGLEEGAGLLRLVR